MRYVQIAVAALLSTVLTGATAQADTVASSPNRCFSMINFENWKAPDTKTIYIRVGLNRFYRLDLAGTCSTLTTPGSHLITKTRGSDQVCSGIDWDLSVSDSTGFGDHGFRQGCIVKTQTALTPEQVSAIPKKFKP